MTDRDDAVLITPEHNQPVESYGSTAQKNDFSRKKDSDAAECFFRDGKRRIGAFCGGGGSGGEGKMVVVVGKGRWW